jgi:hypothetical protein
MKLLYMPVDFRSTVSDIFNRDFHYCSPWSFCICQLTFRVQSVVQLTGIFFPFPNVKMVSIEMAHQGRTSPVLAFSLSWRPRSSFYFSILLCLASCRWSPSSWWAVMSTTKTPSRFFTIGSGFLPFRRTQSRFCRHYCFLVLYHYLL